MAERRLQWTLRLKGDSGRGVARLCWRHMVVREMLVPAMCPCQRRLWTRRLDWEGLLLALESWRRLRRLGKLVNHDSVVEIVVLEVVMEGFMANGRRRLGRARPLGLGSLYGIVFELL